MKSLNILDPGFELTLRPMKYPQFFDMFKNAIKNTWTVEEINFGRDITDLKKNMSPKDIHLIHRLIAFFATGDTIVSNNLVLTLYKHINSPEARMYLSRQLYEEAVHIQFYLTLLDEYIPNLEERSKAFDAVNNIPSIRKKAEFCEKWTDYSSQLEKLETEYDKKKFLMTLIAFACAVEGLFFFAAFAYVYYFRSRGLLPGLAAGTNWVFRDESFHISFALEVYNVTKKENPQLFDEELNSKIYEMMEDALECEYQFAIDVLGENPQGGLPGLPLSDIKQYLMYTADNNLERLGLKRRYNVTQPLDFMNLQDIQELTNFFERKPSAYQTNLEYNLNGGSQLKLDDDDF